MVELGPVMEEEGEVLSSLVGMVCPKVIVEFGYLTGRSTHYLLKNLPKDSNIYSFDIKKGLTKQPDERHTLYICRQQDFNISQTNGEKIDFVFFDGAHDLEINKQTWEKIKQHLSENCIICVHDTGLWDTRVFNNKQLGVMVDDIYRAHQPDEIKFVEYLKSIGLNTIHLTPKHVLRHGITILQ